MSTAPPRHDRIIYTRPDGGVNLCHPSAECMAWMTGGGGYWADFPRGYEDEQVRRKVAEGCCEYAASRFCRAMMRGGCTDAEALEIIRDRDCGHLGSGFELMDAAELPDHWFRDAWRRSHNGGPISIDMKTAKRIQYQRIQKISQKFHLKLPLWRNRVARAQTPDELKAVWPKCSHAVNAN